jgi:hypothetical protein
MAKLPQVLRDIRLELIETSSPGGTSRSIDASHRSSAEGELT